MNRRGMAVAFVLALSACTRLPPGKVYALNIDDARTRLQGIEMPLAVFGSSPLRQTERIISPDRISWQITDPDDAALFAAVADLTGDKPGTTRVAVTFQGASEGPHAQVESKLVEKPSIREFYRAAMEERVAAALEGRSFEFTRTLRPMMAAAFANMSDLTANFDRAAASHDAMMKSNIAGAYAREAGAQH